MQPSDFSHLSRGYEEFKRRETAGLIASALELQFLVLWQSAKSKDDPPSWFSKALEVGTNTNVWWGTEAAEAKARDFLRNTHKRAPPREPLPGSLNLGKPPVDLDSAHEDHD